VDVVNDVASRVLLTQGVGTLCVTGISGCSVYSRSLGSFSVPGFPSPYREAAIARDAFCAALAAQLIRHDGQFSEEVALWATAAMAAATADHPMPNPMPNWSRVEQILDQSPFSVSLRATSDGDADTPRS
jgi:ribokinase